MEKVMVKSVAVRLHRELQKQMFCRVQENGFSDQQVEEAVMAWFSFFTALRFMEVKGLAKEGYRGLDNGTEGLLEEAGRLSVRIPYLFHRIMELDERLRPEWDMPEIRRLLTEELAEEFWQPVQILGWLFQYANGEKKEEAFRLLKQKVKISTERLPVATQLFTPQWIVRYLAENSLCMKVEGRRKWKYKETGNAQTEPVHRRLKEVLKKKKLEEIRCIDPCMGSGHILVELFDLFAECYLKQGYSRKQAAERILEYNLAGVDIDPQVEELAGFSLWMKAWLLDREAEIPALRIAYCTWDESFREQIKKAPERKEEILGLVQQCRQAERLGALLCPSVRDYEALEALCESEKSHHMVRSAWILSERYDVVITNPPYLNSSGMEKELQEILRKEYPDTGMDLSVAMMQRSQSLALEDGLIAMINIPVWMTLSSYQNYRRSLLQSVTILSILMMGRGVFGSDFGSCAFVMLNQRVEGYRGSYRKLYDRKSEVESVHTKEERYFSGQQRYIQDQQDFLQIPGCPVAYALNEKLKDSFAQGTSVDSLAHVRQGMATGNNGKYLRFWYEVPFTEIASDCHDLQEFIDSKRKYVPYNKGGAYCKWYGNQDYVILFDEEARKQLAVSGNRMPSRQYYFKPCLTWSKVTIGGFSMRMQPAGSVFDVSGCSIFADKEKCLELLGFFNSETAQRILGYFSPTVNYEVGHVKAMPVLPYMDEMTEQRILENIQLSREDRKQFETCREFESHPLLKYQCGLKEAYPLWVQECHQRYSTVKENEKQINQRIDRFYLCETEQNRESPVTIHRFTEEKKGKDHWSLTSTEAAVSFISYGIGCLLGRYDVHKKGIVDDPEAPEVLILDETQTVDRFCTWLRSALKKQDIEEDLHWLALQLHGKGSDREILGQYLCDHFYPDHFRLYQKHPVYWLFTSDKKGFKMLIYMHHCQHCMSEMIAVAQQWDRDLAEKLKKHQKQGDRPDPEKGFKENLAVFKDCMRTG